ncbi:MAG: MotA/TolQ/ExbB proton channel family protein [Acidobacteriota bacterium]|nr:MotA/TolQ/ExbB proton channel family protein [Acidobacteriota bacterium]
MFQGLFEQAWGIWRAGGWWMIPLAANALVLFALGIHIWISLKSRGVPRVSERVWREWITRPEKRRGRLGEVMDFALAATSIEDLLDRFGEVQLSRLAPFERDLRFMKRCVSSAPLLGLLGTVTGMLTTFAALASGSGGEKTMSMIAGGISEALITTETGLVIALPGLFLQYHLGREKERYEAFLARVETVCVQHVFHRQRGGRSAGKESAL